MRYYRPLTACLLLGLTASVARADELFLKNGDHLTGKVQSIMRGQLTFASAQAGTVRVSLANIQRFTMDQPAQIVLADGTRIKGTITAAEDGTLTLVVDGEQRPVTLTDLAAINPEVIRWHGGLTAGLTILDNLINTRQWNVTGNAQKLSRSTDLSFDGAYLRARQGDKTTEDFAFLNGELKFGKNAKRFGFVNTNLRTDRVQKLTLRVLAGAGIGFHWFNNPTTELTTNTGLTFRSDDFQAASTKQKLAAEIGYNFRWNVRAGTTFKHGLHYFPTLDDPGDSYLLAQFQLDQNFTDQIYLNARVIMDQTTRPGPNAARITRKITVGLGTRF